MIGTAAGISLLIGYLRAAWNGNAGSGFYDSGLAVGFVGIAFFLVVGVVLFPRTIGLAFTPPIFVTPVAFIIGTIRHGFIFGLSMLLLGLGSWLITLIIGKIRPEAT